MTQKPTPNRPKKWTALLLQFIKFGIVGVSNTLISLAIYYLFVWISKDLYMAGNIVGFFVSVLNAFFWNNKYVFKSKQNHWKELLLRLLKTYLSYAFVFVLTSVLLYFEVRHWGVSEWLAPIINLFLTVPLNFLLNKFWAFREKPQPGSFTQTQKEHAALEFSHLSTAEYEDHLTRVLDRYKRKQPNDPLICLPVYDDAGVITAWLRPITADYLRTAPACVEQMSRWRVENPTISTGTFTVTHQRTQKWLDAYVVDNPGRIIFLVMDFTGRFVGHIGLAAFEYTARTAEIDSVLRGEKDAPRGLMQFCMRSIIHWGQTELGLRDITLKVFNDNTHAVTFYKRCGFEEVRTIPLVKIVLPDEEKWEIGTEEDRATAQKFYLEMRYTGPAKE